jgi:dienelactone hydrolase
MALGAGAVIVLLSGVFVIRSSPKDNGSAPPLQRPPSPKIVATAPEVLPPFPGRGQGREIVPGVMVHSIRLGTSAESAAPGQGMTLWLYLPEGKHEPGTLPCVLIAPAGTILLTGIGLAEGDRPEHIPFAREGFAVLAYELDGPISDRDMNSAAKLKVACEAFLAARCGLTNAKFALDWLNAQVPEVDKSRIFTAGHSSAGTMALLLVENEPRVRACAAFNAPANTEDNFDEGSKGQFRRFIPQLDEVFTTYNPLRHAERIKVPLFLFNSLEDTVVPAESMKSFAATLKGLNKQVVLEIVPTGDHHASMIEQGIPRAINWFKQFKSP